MKKLDDLIKVYPGIVPPEMCDSLVEWFDKQETVRRDSKWDVDYKAFDEVDLVQYPEMELVVSDLYQLSNAVAHEYYREVGTFFPSNLGFEDLRMKRYNANGTDQFGWHADVGDYASARRFLVMFYYLNDVAEGGETEFHEGPKIKPAKGSVVVFPPMWMFPHRGTVPVSGPKYILSTYLHYQ